MISAPSCTCFALTAPEGAGAVRGRRFVNDNRNNNVSLPQADD